MANNSEWEDRVRKKIRYMTNQVWDGIKSTDVDRFMGNFSDNDKIVGWVLLDMLIYYSNEQEESIITNLIRLLKRDLWLELYKTNKEMSSDTINKEIDKAFNKMCFIPVDDRSDLSSSSYILTGQFKKSVDVPNSVSYIKLTEVPLMIALQKKYFVFYDDIIGTGNQFKSFWQNKVFGESEKRSLADLADNNPDIKFYYLVLGGCQDGIEFINKKIPDVKIIVSELFSRDYDVFSEKNEYWELNPDNKGYVLDYISSKEDNLGFKTKFSKNISVLFQHGRASNTALPLYWREKGDDWKELYKR